MAEQMRATVVAQYPLPGGGKVALTVLSESLTGEHYKQLAEIVRLMVVLAESLGWSRDRQSPARTERPRRKRIEPEPAPRPLSVVLPGLVPIEIKEEQ